MSGLRPITVTEYNNYIKQIFDAEEMLHNVQVVGEVTEFSIHNGIAYFKLKDNSAAIDCISFSADVNSALKEGTEFVATGSPNYYTKGGKLNFKVVRLEAAGLGDLYKKFMLLKEALKNQGLFNEEHKKPLPDIIKRIGVITAKDGAVIQDIKSVAWRRNPSVDIVLFPVKVQGIGAEFEIANAIRKMSEYNEIDVIIVARGGGSLEDLMAYNTEVVARAAYECQKPIVSAVGHETDFTIIDFVADLRAPTPSAAAELLTFDAKAKNQTAKNLALRFLNSACAFSLAKRGEISSLNKQMFDAYECFLKNKRFSTERVINKLITLTEIFKNEKQYEVSLLTTKFEKLNPLEILKMGYAKLEQCGQPIDSVKKLVLLSNINIILKDGEVIAKPEEIK